MRPQRLIPAALCAALVAAAPAWAELAAGDASSLSSQYAAWAGSKSNADALVSGALHYDGLAEIRERQGLPESASSPEFLIKAHTDAMTDRAARGEPVENKVRAAARKLMRRKSAPAGPPSGSGE